MNFIIIRDFLEYAGRQPHVDGSGATDFQMQPFTGREDFSVMTRLLSFADPETTKTTSLDGTFSQDFNFFKYFDYLIKPTSRFVSLFSLSFLKGTRGLFFSSSSPFTK